MNESVLKLLEPVFLLDAVWIVESAVEVVSPFE